MENEFYGCIFVVSDTAVNEVNNHTFQLISKGIEIANILNKKLILLYVGNYYENEILKLKGFSIDEVIIVPKSNDKLTDEQYRNIYIEFINKYSPEIILMCASVRSRAIASQVSTMINAALTAECTQITISEDKEIIFTRPAFSSLLLANIGCKNTFIKMCTIRKNVFNIIKSDESAEPKIVIDNLNVEEDVNKTILRKHANIDKTSNIEKAKIIVAGGRGLGANGFYLLKEFAKNINATVGGTRVAVENGWIEYENQIGQSGTNICPDVYINFGISGALQHTVGIISAKKIISINIDENAPIFNHSDYKIVGDAFEILLSLVERTTKFNE